jgi:hypothetical protein
MSPVELCRSLDCSAMPGDEPVNSAALKDGKSDTSILIALGMKEMLIRVVL